MDVSNTTFWQETTVSQLAKLITDAEDVQDCVNRIQPVPSVPGSKVMKESNYHAALRRLNKNNVEVLFRGASDSKPYHSGLSVQTLVSNAS